MKRSSASPGACQASAKRNTPSSSLRKYLPHSQPLVSHTARSTPVNEETWGGIGVMLMKDAAVGVGPYGYVKGGLMGTPHVVDVSAHGGMTTQIGKDLGRVRTIADVDGFVGVLIPVQQTFLPSPTVNFGLVASGGMTF